MFLCVAKYGCQIWIRDSHQPSRCLVVLGSGILSQKAVHPIQSLTIKSFFIPARHHKRNFL